jgi:hypothetical protein
MRTCTQDWKGESPRLLTESEDLVANMQTLNSRLSSAELCRLNGWGPGTRLIGDEGHGPTVIEITAIGSDDIMARAISHNGEPCWPRGGIENKWGLEHRDWSLHHESDKR